MAADRRRPRGGGMPFRRIQFICIIQFIIAFSYTCSSSSDVVKGTQTVQPYCRNDFVHVTKVVLTCDSPGAYYYGSSTYRNSEVCMSNDKANLKLYITISSRIEPESVLLTVESGFFDHFQTVIESIDLCSAVLVVGGSSSSSENATSQYCPSSDVEYILKTYFTVPVLRDYNLHYVPDLRFTFLDGRNGRRIGCAATGAIALEKLSIHQAEMGLLLLGVSTAVFLSVFGALLYMTYRKKKRMEWERESSMRRYNYFRTLPTGQMVALPTASGSTSPQGGGLASPSSEDDASESAMSISNPSYNTPQVPTRPII